MIDSVRLDIKAGNGGNGCASFLREKYKPHGGPDGGDGGHGGNALLQGDSSYNTLLHLRFTSTIYVDRGAHGRGKDRKGKNGEDEVLKVPLGTQVFRREPDGSRTLLADICDDTPVLVAQGGLGGWGNARYVSATNQEPVLAQRGGAGERVTLFLELKLLADVALVARPNAGKSSLVSRTTGASPRIADYPFTTVEPVLGVVYTRGKGFVLMEIPGLLEGAHRGIGLGHQFLRHAERARLYIHLLDGLSEDPVADLDMVNKELLQFSPGLVEKPQIVAVNKVDVTEVREAQESLREAISQRTGPGGLKPLVYFISAVTGEGVEDLMGEVIRLLDTLPKDLTETVITAEAPRGRQRMDRSSTVTLQDGVYVVHSEKLERLVALADTRDTRVLLQLWREMGREGIASRLQQAGIEAGDTIRIGQAEVEWF